MLIRSVNNSEDLLEIRRKKSMKLHLLFALFLGLFSSLGASQHQVCIEFATVPVYYNKTSPVRYIQVPRVLWDSNYEKQSYIYGEEFKAGEGDLKADINLISLYDLKVIFHYNPSARLEIITKNAKKNGKFTIDEVVKMTARAIRMNYPNKDKISVFVDGKKYEEPKKIKNNESQ